MNSRIVSAFLVIAVVFGLTTATQAAVISFNFRSSGATAMGSSETAGAPGVNDDNWNDALPGATISAGNIKDGDGNTVNLMTMSLSTPIGGVVNQSASPGDDRLLFAYMDIFGGGGSSELTATFTNIPYAAYDVYVYAPGWPNAAQGGRGGEVWANGYGTGTRKSLVHIDGDPSDPANWYSEGDDLNPFDTVNTARGTYLVFRGLTGSSLTLDYETINIRFGQSGVQIVGEPIPEPSALVLSVIGVIGLCTLGRRRRRNVKA